MFCLILATNLILANKLTIFSKGNEQIFVISYLYFSQINKMEKTLKTYVLTKLTEIHYVIIYCIFDNK